MQQIAPYLPQLTPDLRHALMSWHGWRSVDDDPPRVDRMRIADITGLGLAVSLSEALWTPDAEDVTDFLCIYVCPKLRALGLGRTEGSRMSDRPHTRVGSPTHAANIAAVTSGRAQFFDASGERGRVGFAITAVHIET